MTGKLSPSIYKNVIILLLPLIDSLVVFSRLKNIFFRTLMLLLLF